VADAELYFLLSVKNGNGNQGDEASMATTKRAFVVSMSGGVPRRLFGADAPNGLLFLGLRRPGCVVLKMPFVKKYLHISKNHIKILI
jgi:hypothetical protein